MFISRASFTNFRNLKPIDLVFNPGFMVLVGPNGAGKTNFLEGLYFTSTLKRFPESDLHQLLAAQQGFFRCRVEYGLPNETALEVTGERAPEDRVQLELKKDGQTVMRQKYTGSAPVISFLPQDIGLLARSPQTRRRYLDETLSATSPEYRLALGQYERTVKQRNDLLQKIQIQEAAVADLEIWDERLAEFGALITSQRGELFLYLNNHLANTITAFAPELSAAKFFYRNSGTGNKAQFLAALSGLRRAECVRGLTLMGPHRDDFSVSLDGQEVVGFFSRGQIRSTVLALKLLEKNFVEERVRKSPVMILDDVFSEFDPPHQEKLVSALAGLEQVFFSTSQLSEVERYMPEATQVFEVFEGRIVKKHV